MAIGWVIATVAADGVPSKKPVRSLANSASAAKTNGRLTVSQARSRTTFQPTLLQYTALIGWAGPIGSARSHLVLLMVGVHSKKHARLFTNSASEMIVNGELTVSPARSRLIFRPYPIGHTKLIGLAGPIGSAQSHLVLLMVGGRSRKLAHLFAVSDSQTQASGLLTASQARDRT